MIAIMIAIKKSILIILEIYKNKLSGQLSKFCSEGVITLAIISLRIK